MSGSATRGVGLISPSRYARGLICVLGLLAAAVAAYLLFLSVSNRGLPLGCGAGSGCEEILTSRWSQVLGIPVSGPALAVYIAIVASALFIEPGSPRLGRQIAWQLLLVLSGLVIASALWFSGLQLFVLKAVCPWCLVDHALGLAIAGLVFWIAFDSRTRQAESNSAANNRFERAQSVLFTGVGVLMVAGLATVQWISDYRPAQPSRLPAGMNADSGPGADRAIAVLDGSLRIDVHDVPTLGSADAPKLLVMLFDYCCPHCRATHGYLLDRMPRYSEQMGVVLLPTPLNSQCNPYWERTEPRFRDACELASLSLAVWKADRSAFARFDAWLFEPETPRDAQEARRYAEQLVPPAALEAALGDPWIGERIEQAVKAYRDSRAERIPVIMSPGMAAVVGRPESADELSKLLELELGLKPADMVTSNDRK